MALGWPPLAEKVPAHCTIYIQHMHVDHHLVAMGCSCLSKRFGYSVVRYHP
jgi:hypothetical protein